MFTLTASVNCIFFFSVCACVRACVWHTILLYCALWFTWFLFFPPVSLYCKYVPLCGSVVCFLTPRSLCLSSRVCLAAFHLISQLWSLTVSLTLTDSLPFSQFARHFALCCRQPHVQLAVSFFCRPMTLFQHSFQWCLMFSVGSNKAFLS